MATSKGPLTQRAAWKTLQAHYRDIRGQHLREWFADDPTRGERLTAEAVGIYLDYSKNRITDETLKLLVNWPNESDLRDRIDAMFRGEKINITENRAVLHVALRAPRGATILVDGENVVPAGPCRARQDGGLLRPRPARRLEGPHRQAHPQRHQHRHRRLRPRAGDGLRGAAALQRPRPDLPLRLQRRRHRFRRGDPRPRPRRNALHRLLQDLHDPGDDDQRRHARATGSLKGLGGDAKAVAKHFVAVSTNAAKVSEVRHRHGQHVRLLGLGRRPLFDGLGHRPLDDARHRPGAISATMLAGFHQMDEHFRTAPFERNLPVLMGLLAVWYNDFFGAQTVAVLPYEQYLKRFPAYLQQLTMESNGKHVTLDGDRGRLRHRPDLLGRAGHQRPALLLPADPPGHEAHPLRLHRLRPGAQPAGPAPRHAPGERLRPGRGAGLRQDARAGQGRGHAGLAGARTGSSRATARRTRSSLERLTPAALGKLVALYEHSVFTQGAIWDIDSFDQWGVELGKVLAQRIIPELDGKTEPQLTHDSSTNGLIRRYRKLKESK